MVFRLVELRRVQPVLKHQLPAVSDAQASLFRAVDEEQPADRSERLATQGVLAFLLEDDDTASPVGQFG